MDVPKSLNDVPDFLKILFGVWKISYNFLLSVENYYFFYKLSLIDFFVTIVLKLYIYFFIFIFSYFP